jgi:hypothetical protein
MKRYNHAEENNFVKACGIDDVSISIAKSMIIGIHGTMTKKSETIQGVESLARNNESFFRALVIIACKPIIGENKNNSIY